MISFFCLGSSRFLQCSGSAVGYENWDIVDGSGADTYRRRVGVDQPGDDSYLASSVFLKWGTMDLKKIAALMTKKRTEPEVRPEDSSPPMNRVQRRKLARLNRRSRKGRGQHT